MKILECSKEVLEKFDKVDKILIYLSKEYLIYTNDRKLKEKILAKNRRVLTLRLHDVYLN
jgi:rRNA-processing protein FCF1